MVEEKEALHEVSFPATQNALGPAQNGATSRTLNLATFAAGSQHNAALDWATRTLRKAQLHNSLPARSIQAHQGQPPQAVLELLSQGAAVSRVGDVGPVLQPWVGDGNTRRR